MQKADQILNRRDFLQAAAGTAFVLGAGGLVGMSGQAEAAPGVQGGNPFTMPELPYPQNALEPYISEQTVSIHHGKHEAGYFKKTDNLVQGTRLADQELMDVFLAAATLPDKNLYNNAAQAWNHVFYWRGFKPGGSGGPQGRVADAISGSFGSVNKFKDLVVQKGMDQFGSGYVWLIQVRDKLDVVNTPNAINPAISGATPLFTVDVWEHAYYLDYQNRRKEYLTAVLDNLINWEEIGRRLQ